jgi:hypothetical protein
VHNCEPFAVIAVGNLALLLCVYGLTSAAQDKSWQLSSDPLWCVIKIKNLNRGCIFDICVCGPAHPQECSAALCMLHPHELYVYEPNLCVTPCTMLISKYWNVTHLLLQITIYLLCM